MLAARSVHLEADRHGFRAADEVCLRARGFAGQFHRFEARQEFFPQEAHFHPGKVLAKAHMRAIAEGDMLVGRAVDLEAVGIFEHGFVPVGCGPDKR